MTDDPIIEQLRAENPGPDTEQAWTTVTARIRRERRRRRWVTMSAAAAVLVLGLAMTAALVSEPDMGVVADEPAVTPPPTDGGAPVQDAWSVEVATDLTPVSVTTTALEAGSATSWLRHTLRFTNDGSEQVTLDQFDTSQFLGDRELIVGVGGCGYGTIGPDRAALPGACRLMRRSLDIAPGETIELPVGIWRDLEGMNPPAADGYELDIAITYRVGDGPTIDGSLFLRYTTPTGQDSSSTVAVEPTGTEDGPLPAKTEALGGLSVELIVPTDVVSGEELPTRVRVENRTGEPIVDPACILASGSYALLPADDPKGELWITPTVRCAGPATYEPGSTAEFDGPTFVAWTMTGERLSVGEYLAIWEVDGSRLGQPVAVTEL